jgi:hypothetical protein
LRHRGLRVTRANGGIFRHGEFDGLKIFGGECDIKRAERP